MNTLMMTGIAMMKMGTHAAMITDCSQDIYSMIGEDLLIHPELLSNCEASINSSYFDN